MEIKPLSVEEWKKLRDLYLTLLQCDPGAFGDEYVDIELRTEAEWIKSLERKGKTFVAVENGKYIGMGRINIYDELPNTPVLHKLGVLPEYRGKGIARKLVEAREKWAIEQGAHKVRLYVIADRKKTIEFSEKNGYKVTEVLKQNIRRKDGYSVDVVIMEKEL